jgi:hypothetical protein
MSDEQRRAGPDAGGQDDINVAARALNRLGAVETEALGIDLDLSTKSDEQVRIKNIRVVRQCGSPLTGPSSWIRPPDRSALLRVPAAGRRCSR